MLGFAIIDRQSGADVTAVWLTSRIGTTLVGNTNAVVIPHTDPDHDRKVRALTADRAVVLTEGTESPIPFAQTTPIAVFDELIEQTAAHQERICQAIEDYARLHRAKLVAPKFRPVPVQAAPAEDAPPFRALAAADYVGAVWAAWLFTDEQRHRRTVTPKSGTTPWIMPEELNSPAIALFPPEFADRVRPEPLSDRKQLGDNT